MPGPKPVQVNLTEPERQGLEKLIHRYSTPQQIALRARGVLLAATGKNHAELAKALNVSMDMARLWRHRWVVLPPVSLAALSLDERLDDLPRPGTPARLTADQMCQIEQLAREKPEQSERPISQWTGRELADEIMKPGIVETLSPRHAARLLKKGAFGRT